MTWPTNFGSLLGGNQPLSLFDSQFQAVAQIVEVPCSAFGATAISLTPLVNCPVLTGYTEFCAARFRATANSGAPVTAQINGIGFLNVYKADGVTQCGINDLVIGFEYVVRFSQALTGGVGGFFLEAPAFGNGGGGGGGTGITTPGGRLTLTSGVPVMSANATGGGAQTIYYAPYAHPFVPIYNGTAVAMYQFTSGLADTVGLSLPMAGAGDWPAGQPVDVYATLIGGVPKLCTVAWGGIPPARVTGLAIFGGFLTNATLATARPAAGTTITLNANQGTYLGTIDMVANGQSVWIFGAAASGGSAAIFHVYNYYNQVLVNTIVTDNGAPYTYTSTNVRPARGSSGNSVTFMQGTSEKAAIFSRRGTCQLVAVAGAYATTGLGVSTVAYNSFAYIQSPSAGQMGYTVTSSFQVSGTGPIIVYSLESGDNVNANTFDVGTTDQLMGSIWL